VREGVGGGSPSTSRARSRAESVLTYRISGSGDLKIATGALEPSLRICTLYRSLALAVACLGVSSRTFTASDCFFYEFLFNPPP